MNPQLLKAIALDNLALSSAHHIVLFALLTVFWIRRRSMERIVDAYFAAAFATTALALAAAPATRAWAVVAAVLSALWVVDTVNPRNLADFRRAPTLRMVLMAIVGAFAFVYPGYSGDLPGLFFSPIGVILPPTLTIALAILNCAWPGTNRLLHWIHAACGAVVAIIGLFTEGWIHLPLLIASVYALPLLLGRGRIIEGRDPTASRSVRGIRDRMYTRKTFLPGPRDPRAGLNSRSSRTVRRKKRR